MKPSLKLLYVYNYGTRRSPIQSIIRTRGVYLEILQNFIIVSPIGHFGLNQGAFDLIWTKVFEVPSPYGFRVLLGLL